jgi:hypothetical protein
MQFLKSLIAVVLGCIVFVIPASYLVFGMSWLEIGGLVSGIVGGTCVGLVLWRYFKKRKTISLRPLEKFRQKRPPRTIREKIYHSIGLVITAGVAGGIAYAWVRFFKTMNASPVLVILGLPIFFVVFGLGLIVLNRILGLSEWAPSTSVSTKGG